MSKKLNKEALMIKNNSLLANQFDIISSNLIGYLTEFSSFKKLFELMKINKKFKSTIENSIYFQIFLRLIKNTLFMIKKLPESIFTCSNFRNPIKQVDFVNLDIDQRKLISNYLDFIFKNKEEIYFFDNRKITEDGMKYLSYHISFSLCKLKKLEFSNVIENEEFFIKSSFKQSLWENKSLIHLKFKGNNISCYEYIGSAMAKNKLIKKFEILNENLSTENLEKLFIGGMRQNTSLLSLDLSHNKLGKNAGKILGEYLNLNQNLKNLNIEDNELSNEGVSYLADSLKYNKNLLSLDISENLISNEGIEFFSAIFVNNSNTSLKYISLRKNIFNQEGIKTIGQILVKNKTIYTLDIADNDISGSRILPISKALENNKSLVSLDLSNSKLGDKGIKSLKDGLIHNTTLEYLSLRYADLSDSSFDDLKFIISKLTNVNISRNNFSEDNLKFLKELCEIKMKNTPLCPNT